MINHNIINNDVIDNNIINNNMIDNNNIDKKTMNYNKENSFYICYCCLHMTFLKTDLEKHLNKKNNVKQITIVYYQKMK